MFESRRDIHGRAEVIEHVARGHRDARSGMKSELQHDGVARLPLLRVELKLAYIVLDRERRTNCVIGAGEGGHHRTPTVLTTKP